MKKKIKMRKNYLNYYWKKIRQKNWFFLILISFNLFFLHQQKNADKKSWLKIKFFSRKQKTKKKTEFQKNYLYSDLKEKYSQKTLCKSIFISSKFIIRVYWNNFFAKDDSFFQASKLLNIF